MLPLCDAVLALMSVLRAPGLAQRADSLRVAPSGSVVECNLVRAALPRTGVHVEVRLLGGDASRRACASGGLEG